jgi:hypothetical protein
MSLKEAPLLLGRICSSWRKIVLCTPRLWSSLHITVPGGFSWGLYDGGIVNIPDLIAHRNDLAKMWLSRSGARPLPISLFEPKAGYLTPQHEIQPLMRTIILFASRWQRIQFNSLPSMTFLATLDGSDVPLLEPITIGGEPVPGLEALTLQTLGIFSSTSLTCVSLVGVYSSADIICRLRCTQLREVRIEDDEGFTSTGAFDVLHLCPNLIRCRMYILSGNLEENDLIPSKPIPMPLLTDLSITGIDIPQL